MIADTAFVSELIRERCSGRRGPALTFLSRQRKQKFRVTILTAGELAAWMERSQDVWTVLNRWTVYRLHPGIVEAAADVDREMISLGQRLGENDNWIAGFARYYREPVISRDPDFDRVIRRVGY